VVINTEAADGDAWSGVAQARGGGPNGESCAVGGERRVGDDDGGGVGIASGSSAAGGGSGGGGIARAGSGFIGEAWRQWDTGDSCRALSESHSLNNSASHLCLAAFRVRLAGGEAGSVGEGTSHGVDGGGEDAAG
jgi:hypothetical protein